LQLLYSISVFAFKVAHDRAHILDIGKERVFVIDLHGVLGSSRTRHECLEWVKLLVSGVEQKAEGFRRGA
jgi:hypothetical protein